MKTERILNAEEFRSRLPVLHHAFCSDLHHDSFFRVYRICSQRHIAQSTMASVRFETLAGEQLKARATDVTCSIEVNSYKFDLKYYSQKDILKC